MWIRDSGTVATGRVERGTVKVQDTVEIVGLTTEKRSTVVTGVEMFRKLLDQAIAGDNIGVLLRGVQRTDIERGQVCLLYTSILKPQDGQPVVCPTQDMIIGCYYLTLQRDGEKGEGRAFSSEDEAIMAYQNGDITLQSKVRIRMEREWNGEKRLSLIHIYAWRGSSRAGALRLGCGGPVRSLLRRWSGGRCMALCLPKRCGIDAGERIKKYKKMLKTKNISVDKLDRQ